MATSAARHMCANEDPTPIHSPRVNVPHRWQPRGGPRRTTQPPPVVVHGPWCAVLQDAQTTDTARTRRGGGVTPSSEIGTGRASAARSNNQKKMRARAREHDAQGPDDGPGPRSHWKQRTQSRAVRVCRVNMPRGPPIRKSGCSATEQPQVWQRGSQGWGDGPTVHTHTARLPLCAARRHCASEH